MSGANLSIGFVVTGRYRIDGMLGTGAFGAVYRAHDLTEDRPVALKVLHAHRAVKDRDIARFEREAALLKRLRHPNVVEMLDYGPTADGIPYIAFELLEARPLNEVLKERGALPQEIVRRIVTQILRALAAAHEIGIVHRDIKPGNVLVDDLFSVNVLDFGIAKALGVEGEDLVTKLTATGAILGTPAYMAPEQVRGQAIRPSADIYSLGALMAELLSGERLVRASTPIDALTAHISEAPHPLHPAVKSSKLAAVVARAVEKQPEERYASAREMLEALGASPTSGANPPAAGSRGARVAPTRIEPPASAPPSPRVQAPPVAAMKSAPRAPRVPAPPSPRGQALPSAPPPPATAPPATAPPATAGVAATLEEDPERRGGGLGLLVALVAVLAAGAAGWWLFVERPRPEDDGAVLIELDDDSAGDDDDGRGRSSALDPHPDPEPVPPPPPRPSLETLATNTMVAKMTSYHIERRLKRGGYQPSSPVRSPYRKISANAERVSFKYAEGRGTCMLMLFSNDDARRDAQLGFSRHAEMRGAGKQLLIVTAAHADRAREVLTLLLRPPLERPSAAGKKKKKKKKRPQPCDPKDPLCKHGRRIVKPPAPKPPPSKPPPAKDDNPF